MYIQYNKQTKEVLQVTDVMVAVASGNGVICVEKDHTTFDTFSFDDSIGNSIELPTVQRMTTNLTEMKEDVDHHFKHKFDSEILTFEDGVDSYPSDPDIRTFIVGLVSSAQQAITDGDTTWSTTRYTTSGVGKTMTAKEFITHAKAMESYVNTKFGEFLAKKAAIASATTLDSLYTILEA